MYTQKSILLITKKDEQISSQLEEICYSNNLSLSKLYNLSDAIAAVKEFRFGILIIDEKHFPLDIDFLTLFKRKDFYVPCIILINDNEQNINEENINIVKRNELSKLRNIITQNLNKNSYNYPTDHAPFIRSTVEKQLAFLGFSRRYKGFDYLTEIVIKIMGNNNSKRSFKKYIYPYISGLYNVSEESVERDIRNLISKIQPNNIFNFKHTTKNIVNAVVIHIQDYLNELGHFKLKY